MVRAVRLPIPKTPLLIGKIGTELTGKTNSLKGLKTTFRRYMEYSKARAKLTEAQKNLNTIIEAISASGNLNKVLELTDCVNDTAQLFIADADYDRCDGCSELHHKDDLILETFNYLSLCKSCRKPDDTAYPSQSFFGVR